MITPFVRCPELIGRRRELAYLLERFHHVENGEGGIVLITGEAGIGKSRLIAELQRSLNLQSAWFTVGDCLEYVRSPYMPFHEALTRLFGTPMGGGKLPKAAASLASVLARWSGLSESTESKPSEQRKLLEFQTIVRELGKLGHIRPIVIVLEDFHWADAASVELLQYLARSIEGWRALIVITIRTDPIDEVGAISQGPLKLQRSGADRIDLAPLSDNEIAVFVQQILGKHTIVSTDTLRRIEELADGNPLYAEELLRNAFPSGKEEAEPDEAAPLTIALEPPSSLRATILTRLQKLSSVERGIIEQAAVIGRQFTLELLAEITSQPLDTVRATVRHARDLYLIVERAGDAYQHARAVSTMYSFRHALIREIIYRELLAVETFHLHERIASELERRDERSVAELAYHWTAAGSQEKAVHYNVLAGEAAAKAFSHGDAARFYRAALQFLPRPSERTANLCERLAFECYAGGLSSDAKYWSSQAIEEFTQLGLHEKIAGMLLHLARLCYFAGDIYESLTIARQAIDACDHTKSIEYFRAYTMVARLTALLTHWEESLEYLAEIEDEEPSKPPNLRAAFHDVYGLTLANLGNIDEAMSNFETAITLAEASGDVEALLLALNNQGFVLSWLGQNAKAIQWYKRAASLADEKGFILGSGFVILGYARALFRTGDVIGAKALLERGLEIGGNVPLNQIVIAEIGIPLGLALGDERFLRRIVDLDTLEMVFALDSSERVGATVSGFVDWSLRNGEKEQACALITRGIERLESASQSWTLLLQAVAHGSEADVRQARTLLERDADVPNHAASQAFLTFFDALAMRRQGDSATDKAREAAAQFETLGWPLFQAQAFEIAGDISRALEVYRKIGAAGDEHRLEAAPQEKRIRQRGKGPLTRREEEVARLVSEGHSSRAIAMALHISERTIHHHIESIFNRLGLSSRAQLVAFILNPENTPEQTA